MSQTILGHMRNVREWRERCQQFINTIADDALENLTSLTTTDDSSLETLDALLVRKLTSEASVSNDNLNNDGYAEYGGDDDDLETFQMPSQNLWPGPASRQLSISSSLNSIAGQAVYIKHTVTKTYPCFKDSDNGVMALNKDELVFVDWVLQADGTGQLKMRIASINDSIVEANEEEGNTEEGNTEETYQNRFRIVSFPSEIQNMRAVDIEYARCKSAYIIGLNAQGSLNEHSPAYRSPWLYLFDSTQDIFEPWIPLLNPHENYGLLNRICCCNKEPIIYLITNKFGNVGILVLDEWGTIQCRKYASDLFPEYERARLIDIACTGNNDLLAIAYNSSTRESEGRFGVRLWDPTTWVRMSNLDLGLISVPFTIPRLVWLNQHDMFALVNQLNGQLYVFDRRATILGQRSFIVYVDGYNPPSVSPINICVAEKDLVAIRYTRFINIHRVNV